MQLKVKNSNINVCACIHYSEKKAMDIFNKVIETNYFVKGTSLFFIYSFHFQKRCIYVRKCCKLVCRSDHIKMYKLTISLYSLKIQTTLYTFISAVFK